MSLVRPHFLNVENQEGVPSKKEITNLVSGDYVKVCNENERFWVQIVEKKTRGYFVGIVMNKLVFYTTYTIGDLVQFHSRHIYAIKTD